MCKLNPNIKAIFGTRGMFDKVFKELGEDQYPVFGQTVDTGISSIYGVPIFVCETDEEAFRTAYEYAVKNSVTAAALSEKESNFTTIDGAKIVTLREGMFAEMLKPRFPDPVFPDPAYDLRVRYDPRVVL